MEEYGMTRKGYYFAGEFIPWPQEILEGWDHLEELTRVLQNLKAQQEELEKKYKELKEKKYGQP